jgi:NitT/TauT family transport system permease protein
MASLRLSAPRRIHQAVTPPLIFLVFLVLLWKLALWNEWVSDTIIPHPEDVVFSFVDLVFSDIIWDDTAATLWETVAGFLLGAVIALSLAVPSGLWETMRRMLHPYAIGLQVTPRIAVAPIIIAWAGFGYSSKIWIAAIIAFFPIYVNALTGILTVDEESREMFRSLGASRWQSFSRLVVPSSLPIMFAGLKTAAGLALVGAVVGEFISAQRGLGVLVQQFSYQLAVDDAFAVILILTIMGLLLFALMEWLERVTVFWLHDARLVARTRRRQARAQKRSGRGSDQPSDPTTTPAETAGLAR